MLKFLTTLLFVSCASVPVPEHDSRLMPHVHAFMADAMQWGYSPVMPNVVRYAPLLHVDRAGQCYIEERILEIDPTLTWYDTRVAVYHEMVHCALGKDEHYDMSPSIFNSQLLRVDTIQELQMYIEKLFTTDIL